MSDVAIEASEPMQLAHLSPMVLSDIVAKLEALSDINQHTLDSLKLSYPELRFTLCFEQEMGTREAYLEANHFDLHLVSHSLSGCSSLTFDLAACSGLVIALRDE